MGLKDMLKAAAAAVVPLISACEDGPQVVSNFDRGGSMIESMVAYASAKGPMLALVRGNPFGGSEADLANTVRTRMTESVGERIIRYTADENEAPHPNIRILILFGAPGTANGHRLCEGKIPTLAVNPDKITIRGVLCADGELLSDAEGWSRKVDGPDDQRFERLLFDLTRALLKPKS